MNRRTNPEVHASIWFRKEANPLKPGAVLLVKVENLSAVMARYSMVKIKLPLFKSGWFTFTDEHREIPVNEETTGFAWSVKARFGGGLKSPLFPGDSTIVKIPMESAAPMLDIKTHQPLVSANVVDTEIFADSAPVVRAMLSIDSVLRGWTSCRPT